ncbi:MAG: barstar family protein [Clostridia bacterium]|nr:barstar family protein [Clostridia bacterium]
MNAYIIDGMNMTDRAAAHAELARALNLLPHYGANLDALWDEVSCMRADVTLVHPAAMLNALGIYGCKLLQTLYEAAAENPDFHFHTQD